MSDLSAGSEVALPQSRRRATVRRYIGGGSEGSVYDVVVEPTGEHHALKWYFPSRAHARQRAAIDELVERGSPDDRFLWPTEIAVVTGQPTFGYLMPLRDHSSVGLADLLTGKVDVPFSTVCTLGMELSRHVLGVAQPRPVLPRHQFRQRLLRSPDRSTTDLRQRQRRRRRRLAFGVLGTRRFMAPEIVRREAAPSTATDLYSLSVLLFYLLMVGHPLVGRRELEFRVWDDHAESVLFGRDPKFVFDPNDRSNAPLPEEHGSVLTNWQLYPGADPPSVHAGVHDRLDRSGNGRVRESVWRSALARCAIW